MAERVPKSKVKEIMMNPSWKEHQKMKFVREMQSGQVVVDPKRKPHR